MCSLCKCCSSCSNSCSSCPASPDKSLDGQLANLLGLNHRLVDSSNISLNDVRGFTSAVGVEQTGDDEEDEEDEETEEEVSIDLGSDDYIVIVSDEENSDVV